MVNTEIVLIVAGLTFVAIFAVLFSGELEASQESAYLTPDQALSALESAAAGDPTQVEFDTFLSRPIKDEYLESVRQRSIAAVEEHISLGAPLSTIDLEGRRVIGHLIDAIRVRSALRTLIDGTTNSSLPVPQVEDDYLESVTRQANAIVEMSAADTAEAPGTRLWGHQALHDLLADLEAQSVIEAVVLRHRSTKLEVERAGFKLGDGSTREDQKAIAKASVQSAIRALAIKLRILGVSTVVDDQEPLVEWRGLRVEAHQRFHVRGGSIEWVAVSYYVSPAAEDAAVAVHFGIPDDRLSLRLSGFRLESYRRRRLPFIGEAVGLGWRGIDCGLGLNQRLLEAPAISKALIDARLTLVIRPDLERACWVLSTSPERIREAVTRPLWFSYEQLGKTILDLPLTVGTVPNDPSSA